MKLSLTFRTKARQKKTKKSGDLTESQRVGRERENNAVKKYMVHDRKQGNGVKEEKNMSEEGSGELAVVLHTRLSFKINIIIYIFCLS